MERFVLVLVSIHNSKIKKPLVTKTEVPTYQVEKTLEYQVDSLKKEQSKDFSLKLIHWLTNFYHHLE